MGLKIKSRPEDFTVEEIAKLLLQNEKAEFAVFILEKKGWGTVELLNLLSRKLSLPRTCFAYGGRKDRHAFTSQYISIKNGQGLELKEKSYSLRFCGYSRRPMGPDLIEGNRFKIIIRNLEQKQIEDALQELIQVRQTGYPNYFDDQRFGSFSAEQGFIVEKILKKQYNGALKIYLTAVYPSDKALDRQRKEFFFRHWREWKACLASSRSKFEKLAFGHLVEKPTDFLAPLYRIPKEEMAFFIAAYQSYLWNELLRNIVKTAAKDTRIYPGKTGDYIFYCGLEKNALGYLRSLKLPTPGPKAMMPDALSKRHTRRYWKRRD